METTPPQKSPNGTRAAMDTAKLIIAVVTITIAVTGSIFTAAFKVLEGPETKIEIIDAKVTEILVRQAELRSEVAHIADDLQDHVDRTEGRQ